jgi:hypothetical protein
MPRARTAGDGRRWRQLWAGGKKARGNGWRAASRKRGNGLTGEKTATPNQKGKWMTEEGEEEQLKLGQECVQRTQGVGHAIEQYAALQLGSDAKLGGVGEDT